MNDKTSRQRVKDAIAVLTHISKMMDESADTELNSTELEDKEHKYKS
jgi:hypothetical protein